MQNKSSAEVAMATSNLQPETEAYLRNLFSFYLLTIKQKLLSIAQKYYVYDEYGNPIFFVVRPPKTPLLIFAGLASFIAQLTIFIFAIRLFFQSGQILLPLIIMLFGGYLSTFIRILLLPYRDIWIYTDESESFPVLLLRQENKFGYYQRYTIFDAVGGYVATARRHVIHGFWRREWSAVNSRDEELCRVREDSLGLSLMRRYLGTLFGILRTNFNFELPNGTQVGEYNRKLTLTDQYILDLRDDRDYLVDRRVALALGILLDTGEGR